MQTRTIGDVIVSAIGLGAMPLSSIGTVPEERALETIHAALDAGVTLIDTADAYAPTAAEFGHNERLVGRALRSRGGDVSHVLVATKGGHTRPSGTEWGQDGRPEYLKEAARASAQRLGVDAIGLYQYHRPDPKVPYEDSIGALRDLLDEGVIRMAGISNANPEQILLANDILGGRLASVQNQFSPAFRSSRPELDLCAELGIAFLPWSPLGGIGKAADLGSDFAPFKVLAETYGATPQRIALAWELALAPVVIPIPGASRPETIRDSALAVDLDLGGDAVTQLSEESTRVP